MGSARWTSSRTSRRSWRQSATPSSPNSTSKVEHQKAPCPTECPTECLMEWLVGCRKDQPALDQTLVQQSRKSTRSMLLYFSSLLRNSVSVIEHEHVIYYQSILTEIYICLECKK